MRVADSAAQPVRISHRTPHDAVKRSVDALVGLIGSILTAPVIGLLAAAVRLESRGAPIYTQTRSGRDGKPFRIYKLRTMVQDAEFVGAGLAVQEGDSRITRLGRFLRRTSLDELPNLWNILRGDMSLVGPRPTLPVQVDQYTERQRGRLAVKPGLTGWAQVNGRASLPWSERIELDLWYVAHRSLRLDARIIALTVRMVLTGDGLYKGPTGGWQGTLTHPGEPPAGPAPLEPTALEPAPIEPAPIEPVPLGPAPLEPPRLEPPPLEPPPGPARTAKPR